MKLKELIPLKKHVSKSKYIFRKFKDQVKQDDYQDLKLLQSSKKCTR